MPGITSIQQLRQQRHAQWLAGLKERINALLDAEPVDAQGHRQACESGPMVRPDQIYLFGSRARGDWDGLSDTDLLVVPRNTHEAERWADRLLEQGLAQDAIGLDREAWLHQARNDLALARLAREHGFLAQACYYAPQAAEEALKGALLELGIEPPHTHVLNDLVRRARSRNRTTSINQTIFLV